MLITWELADNYSFYRGIYRAKHPTAARLPRPLPYDDQLKAKPLWDAIAQGFESARRPDASTNGRAR
jgi:endo-1,4-beta-xylanase